MNWTISDYTVKIIDINEKNIGRRIEPWGKPQWVRYILELKPFIWNTIVTYFINN